MQCNKGLTIYQASCRPDITGYFTPQVIFLSNKKFTGSLVIEKGFKILNYKTNVRIFYYCI